jgi:hypothetical protein
MVYESAKDATFSIAYSLTPDRFVIDDGDDMPLYDSARFTLGASDDFLLFDNETPGKVRYATHSGSNKLAVNTLARVLFDPEYALYCDIIREGATSSHRETTQVEATVPYSNRRRLARTALHAEAEGVTQEVRDLQARIVSTSDGGDGEDLRLSDELSDDQPTDVPVQVQPDF